MKKVVYYSPIVRSHAALERFVHYYNYQLYHEVHNNVTPADMYYCKGERILKQLEKIKRQSIEKRREL